MRFLIWMTLYRLIGLMRWSLKKHSAQYFNFHMMGTSVPGSTSIKLSLTLKKSFSKDETHSSLSLLDGWMDGFLKKKLIWKFNCFKHFMMVNMQLKYLLYRSDMHIASWLDSKPWCRYVWSMQLDRIDYLVPNHWLPPSNETFQHEWQFKHLLDKD